ncbi:hypothetical protein [uncultured Arenimonas sp.]|uniref:hypothetical protein n=1 Tax=uncultured Arenimonas sp. TaxID=546226 RepID=UPI0030D71336
MRRFNPISFLQWQEHMRQTSDDDTVVDCPDCRGDGITACCECGNDRDCEECEGTGTVCWGELSQAEQERHLSVARYEAALVADASAYAAWVGVDPTALLVNSGFRVWCHVAGKRLAAEKVS